MMPQTQLRDLEVDAATPSRTAVIGGSADTGLTVEYYVDSGATGTVTLTLVKAGQTTTWTDAAIAPGYYVQRQLSASSGTKMTLEAVDALARVRWCETVC